jgi:hypothetical protein
MPVLEKNNVPTNPHSLHIYFLTTHHHSQNGNTAGNKVFPLLHGLLYVLYNAAKQIVMRD